MFTIIENVLHDHRQKYTNIYWEVICALSERNYW